MATKRVPLQVDGREVLVSNLDKVLFPKSGTTKGEVIAYYRELAEVILPHLRNRPLTLLRMPDGPGGETFYEKNAPSHTPDWVPTVGVPRSEGGGEIRYILCNDPATLVWVTNLGDLEKHVLLGRVPRLDRPTSLVFDLDPGEGAGLAECGQVALALRRVFEGLGLESFVKVSGSKGLHLNVPLNSTATYEQTQPFAKSTAELLERSHPDLAVSAMAKKLRRGKVLIDWSQNSEHKTTVCVYALRAKQGEPFVSLPITWEELERALQGGRLDELRFSPAAAIKRIRKVGDLFAPVLQLKQKLPAAFTKALGRGKASGRERKQVPEAAPSLRAYAAKRDPSRTPEPMPAKRGGRKKATPAAALRFVIQKHRASHLHYDFRLEMTGTLRSWAVPKGPPLEPRQARLAVQVEDHPLEYADFEGIIPAGNYGAGSVMVWDQGTYEEESGDAARAHQAGKMHLTLHGEKLEGEWVLVRDERGEEGNHWLLLKAGQAQALADGADDRSVLSGRTMDEIAAAQDAAWRSGRKQAGAEKKKETKSRPAPAPGRTRRPAAKAKAARKRRGQPRFHEPMLCRPVETLPKGGEWSFELKFDGYRCLVVKRGRRVQLYSRNQNSLDARFPGLARALAGLEGDFVLDGEAVALDAQGRPSFQQLQNSGTAEAAVHFFAFDLLHREGDDLLDRPWSERRERLQELCATAEPPLHLSPLLSGEPDDILLAVRDLGLEGVVAKRRDSLYQPGQRSGAWCKHQTQLSQEFVLGGYTPGPRGFDALLLGVYEGGALNYVARVRNGFQPAQRERIFAEFRDLQSDQCPFVNLPQKSGRRWGEPLTAAKMAECRWLEPRLVCQVGFVEWTVSANLRHPRFLGLRTDKDPREVRRV